MWWQKATLERYKTCKTTHYTQYLFPWFKRKRNFYQMLFNFMTNTTNTLKIKKSIRAQQRNTFSLEGLAQKKRQKSCTISFRIE